MNSYDCCYKRRFDLRVNPTVNYEKDPRSCGENRLGCWRRKSLIGIKGESCVTEVIASFFRPGINMISRTLVFQILLLLVLLLGGCSSDEIVIGEPTGLGNNEPLELICTIHDKFKKLPRPVFTKVNYYKPWKERKLAAGSYDWSESYDVILHDKAYSFIKEHSAIEINIALLPLIMDPEVGADVLALFDGMRKRGKKPARYPRVPTYLIGKYKDLPATQKYLKKY